VIHPDDWPNVREYLEKLIHSAPGEVLDMTYRVRRIDGVYLWIYSRKMVTDRDKDGNPCTITTILEDISDFIQLQDQLQEKVRQLEAISYRNSHEVRGPVASIIGLVDLIEEKEITSAHNKQVFTYLKDAILKLDKVIHEVNDLSRT
jgi:signal transduction histidine kinase